MAPPLAPTTVNGVQVASGVGVLPVWTRMVRLVPAGVSAVHASAPHATGPFASKTREVRVVDAAYGLLCSQPTRTLLPSTTKSRADGAAGAGGGNGCWAISRAPTKWVRLRDARV